MNDFSRFAGWLSVAIALVANDLPADDAVVRWSGNYLSEGYTGGLYLNRGTEVVLPDRKSYPDLEFEKSPRNPRYDTTLPSAVFYGALQTTFMSPVAEEKSRMQVRHEGGKNRLSLGSEAGSVGNTVGVRGLIVWKKDGFLGSYAGSEIPSLAALKEMAVNIAGIRGKGVVHFVVLSEGDWYFSETLQEGASRGPEPESPGEFRLTLEGSRWGKWSGDVLPPDQAPATYDRTAADLKAVSALGFYFSVEYSASNAAMFEIDAFEVKGDAAP